MQAPGLGRKEEKQRSERKLGKPLGSRSVGECSTRMCEALVLLITHKPSVPVPVYNPSVLEMEAGRPEIQGHPWLPSEFEMSLKYLRPCCKKSRNKWELESEHREA